MNRIHRKVEYALIALKHLRTKAPGELSTAKDVSQLYHTPFDATSRVLQILAQKGYLKSEQGAFGGYVLVRDLQRLSIYDLMEAILGPVEIAKCLQGTCEIKDSCNIVSPVQLLNRKLIDFYQGISVAELVDSRSTKKMVNHEL